MAASPTTRAAVLDDLLLPFRIDIAKCHVLSQRFLANFAHLAAESQEQFLPTPISESILRPVADRGHGRHGMPWREAVLTCRSGGTNLRVGFVELLAKEAAAPLEVGRTVADGQSNGPSKGHRHGHRNGHHLLAVTKPSGRIRRHLERSWPISNHLKNDNADSLFLWIGSCIAEVVGQGCRTLQIPSDRPLPLGVTFSFPTDQHSLSEATIKSMGKGFAVPPDVELGARLEHAYGKFRTAGLPPIRVVAIANDSVSTLVSFIFNYDGAARRRATMGLILGTGSNATVPLRLSHLHPSKRPQRLSVLPGERAQDVKIAVNTEWSINGTEPPMRELGLITPWDDELSAQNERPGFQPLEYMTAGRYLGELGRIILLSYLTETLGLSAETLPPALLERHSLTTTFLSHFNSPTPAALVSKLKAEFPEPTEQSRFTWSEPLAEALYGIAKAIEIRAAGIIAAAIVALLTLAEEIPAGGSATNPDISELGVGYTGGCIVHFQDYLADCQDFVDGLMAKRFGKEAPLRVALNPCHDGGITGAGILVAAALSSRNLET
ncbi:Phosphotransferase [Tolypocladium capitatum]|uniref:Phosphotransferase n=1 Tax=Tolypocladium capitatum TaxID=45235 RepID=A0A2K3QQ61_9HYPO|nr:Phosphotransferase [Tolypocladium capitatum]